MCGNAKQLDLAALVVLVVASFLFMVLCFTRSTMVSRMPDYARVLLGAIVLLALVRVAFKRDYYLPFLGDTVFPCEPLVEKHPLNADTVARVQVEPNSNVIFWASDGKQNNKHIIDNPYAAYGHYSNSGVTRSDADGNAVLHVRNPVPYKIPSGKTLERHVHYRVCGANGMMGRVETVKI